MSNYLCHDMGLFKTFRHISNRIRKAAGQHAMLRDVVRLTGESFKLDRCVVLLLDNSCQEMAIAAEFNRPQLMPLGAKRYKLRTNSEWYSLLAEGRPLPLKEIGADNGAPGVAPELDGFVQDSQCQAVIAFPMVADGHLLGCLSLHCLSSTNQFSEELLEVGESLAQELALTLAQWQALEDKDLEGKVFRESSLPLVVLDKDSCRIIQGNRACRELLALPGQDLKGRDFLELFSESDLQRLREAARSIQLSQRVVTLPSLVVRTDAGGPITLDVSLSDLSCEERSLLLVVLTPQHAMNTSGARLPGAKEGDERESKLEELVATLSKQLSWERVARQIISNLHATLDRDILLQTAADSLSRTLAVSRCLVVRTDGPASPMVTHEYVRADISPLGLGRTSQIPAGVISCIKMRSMAITDLSCPPADSGLSSEDLRYLVDNGFRSMVGSPISHHGVMYGVIIVVQSEYVRRWSNQEVELIETVATQVAAALNHAHNYAQVKEQLFNMNLLGNLTQQLTNALDLAQKTGKRPAEDLEPVLTQLTPPLSTRELEVLKLIASGLANKEIAQRLFLTESTVELHASRIRKKLKLKSRTALVKYACDHNLV